MMDASNNSAIFLAQIYFVIYFTVVYAILL